MNHYKSMRSYQIDNIAIVNDPEHIMEEPKLRPSCLLVELTKFITEEWVSAAGGQCHLKYEEYNVIVATVVSAFYTITILRPKT